MHPRPVPPPRREAPVWLNILVGLITLAAGLVFIVGLLSAL